MDSFSHLISPDFQFMDSAAHYRYRSRSCSCSQLSAPPGLHQALSILASSLAEFQCTNGQAGWLAPITQLYKQTNQKKARPTDRDREQLLALGLIASHASRWYELWRINKMMISPLARWKLCSLQQKSRRDEGGGRLN